jgi:DNA replication and repair protein RecF
VVREEVGTAPLLLLDDVFSELDPQRSEALVRSLPEGQAILTTAGVLPEVVRPEVVLEAVPGSVVPARG